ncbi:MAG: box helicase protein, partial [Actinomycetota bacterium]|nr:box helicase protein [Actinomycetota bacterium]
VICGWPGRHSSLWQQAGRAGRRGRRATAVLVARDDPLDRYLVHHPEVIFDREIETTVLDPDNPYVLLPHLCAAAAEIPLTTADLELFGPGAQEVLRLLVERRVLRRRPRGWYWTHPQRAVDLTNLRSLDGDPFRVVQGHTGLFIGTVPADAAHRTIHPGAVYVHQGQPWLVRTLNLQERVAIVQEGPQDVLTMARQSTTVRVISISERRSAGQKKQDGKDGPDREMCLGTVEVAVRTDSFVRKDATSGKVLGEGTLELPAQVLRTTAMWLAIDEEALADRGVLPPEVPGSLHALEHTLLGMLPLVATCDRQDVAGAWHPCHPDTGAPTVFVHDAAAGGAGFAERGYRSAEQWLQVTHSVLSDCECSAGCPSCVHSTSCSSGNEPLDRAAALRALDTVREGLYPGSSPDGHPSGAGPDRDLDRRQERSQDGNRADRDLDAAVGRDRTGEQGGSVGPRGPGRLGARGRYRTGRGEGGEVCGGLDPVPQDLGPPHQAHGGRAEGDGGDDREHEHGSAPGLSARAGGEP